MHTTDWMNGFIVVEIQPKQHGMEERKEGRKVCMLLIELSKDVCVYSSCFNTYAHDELSKDGIL